VSRPVSAGREVRLSAFGLLAHFTYCQRVADSSVAGTVVSAPGLAHAGDAGAEHLPFSVVVEVIPVAGFFFTADFANGFGCHGRPLLLMNWGISYHVKFANKTSCDKYPP
jgi:hypothetical protein